MYRSLRDPELRTMSGNEALFDRDAELMHFHVRIHCGHPRRRDEINIAEIRSRMFACPDCGQNGPLNIEIRDLPAA
jgi:hypothetical protein